MTYQQTFDYCHFLFMFVIYSDAGRWSVYSTQSCVSSNFRAVTGLELGEQVWNIEAELSLI